MRRPGKTTRLDFRIGHSVSPERADFFFGRGSSSLVPRPFPPPVFDRVLYAKTEGEGLGERVTCVTSGRREGTGRH